MDSSIVSFSNNDTTLQNTTLKPDCSVNVHELALHAMRDRCLLLQRRINALEADNMKLKLESTKSIHRSPYVPLNEDEKYQLNLKIADLNKQKSQLLHHVFMVSCENKNLWNKIAKLKKPDKSKQALVRTNTFLQSTPKSSTNYEEKFSESSLDEISLKLINSYIQEKSQLVEQYEQMSRLQEYEADALNVDSIGFLYMEEPVTDSLKDLHNQTIKMQNLRRELSQQHEDLTAVKGWVEKVLNEGYKCPSCLTKNTKSITSENKEIETSESLTNFATPVDSTNYNENYVEQQFKKGTTDTVTEIPDAEGSGDKICPMCCKTYPENVEFATFQEHVVNHFVGEMEPDSLIDNFPHSSSNIM